MTTATDWDVRDRETNDELRVTDVQAEVDRLDGAATDGRWLPTPRQIPDHVAALLRPLTREQLDAEDTPAAGDHVPDTADVRDRIRLAHASGRLASRLDGQAQIWHEIASTAWAAQAGTPHDSERYDSGREALMARYEAELERLKSGLDHAPYGAYLAAVGDYVRGDTATVQTQRHGGVYAELAPERITSTPDVAMMGASGQAGTQPPDDRAGLDKLTKRVPTALTASAPASQPQTPPQTPATEDTREPWWMRVLRWIGGAA